MLPKQIFLWSDEREVGPYTFEQLKNIWEMGSLNPTLPYWHEGMIEWRPLNELFNVKKTSLPPHPPRANQSNSTLRANEQKVAAERLLLEKMLAEQKKANSQARWFRFSLGLLALSLILKLIAAGLW